MAVVVLGRELARRFTAGQTRLDVAGEVTTVRGVVRDLDVRFPGIGEVLRGDDMAVAIDGQIYQGAMLQPVSAHSEVCFMPAIEGG